MAEHEQLTAEQLAEQIRKLSVADLLVSSASMVAQLAYAKLDPASRDLAQAKLAVEALRALVPVLEGAAADEIVRDLRQLVANLQLAYGDAAGESAAES